MQALYGGDDETARRLAETGELDIFEAASLGDVARLADLLAGDPALALTRSDDDFTPLHYAAFFDGPEAARLLAKGLREQAYAVDVAAEGRTAVFRAQTTEYDAVILDVILPALDGLSVCRELRAAGSSVPILMLTARDAVQSRIAGLDSGADDYLGKPLPPKSIVC